MPYGKFSDGIISSFKDTDRYYTVINPLPFDRDDTVYTSLPIGQPFCDVRGRQLYAADLGIIPASDALTLEMRDLPADLSLKFDYDEKTMAVRTRHVSVSFGEDGAISSIRHCDGDSDICRGGMELNRFTVLGDGNAAVKFLGASVISCGAFELRIRCEYDVGEASHITQDIIFGAKSARIDFHTLVTWREQDSTLMACFDGAEGDGKIGAVLICDGKYADSSDNSEMKLTLCSDDYGSDCFEVKYSLIPYGDGFYLKEAENVALMLKYSAIVVPGRQLQEC